MIPESLSLHASAAAAAVERAHAVVRRALPEGTRPDVRLAVAAAVDELAGALQVLHEYRVQQLLEGHRQEEFLLEQMREVLESLVGPARAPGERGSGSGAR